MMSLPPVPLYYTPFLFGLASLHGSYIREIPAQCGYLLLMGLSILTYAKWNEPFYGKQMVLTADRTLAHSLCLYVVLRSFDISIRYRTLVPASITTGIIGWIFYVYYFARLSWLPDNQWMPWQARIHMATAIGNHSIMFLVHYYRQRAMALALENKAL